MEYLPVIIAVIGVWLLQSFLTYKQSTSMARTINNLKSNYSGHLGVGMVRAKFNLGTGIIVALVLNEKDIIEECLILKGVSVFSEFKSQPQYVGLTIHEAQMLHQNDTKLSQAFNKAINNIFTLREKQQA